MQCCRSLSPREILNVLSLNKFISGMLCNNPLFKLDWLSHLDSNFVNHLWKMALRQNVSQDHPWMKLLIDSGASSRLNQCQLKLLLFDAFELFHAPSLQHLLPLCSVSTTVPSAGPAMSNTELYHYLGAQLDFSRFVDFTTLNCQIRVHGAPQKNFQLLANLQSSVFGECVGTRNKESVEKGFCLWHANYLTNWDIDNAQQLPGLIIWLGVPSEYALLHVTCPRCFGAPNCVVALNFKG